MNLHEDRVADFLGACFRAGIKDPLGFLLEKRIRVFDWLRGAFPRKVIPTDIDGEVELNGRFLRLEFKHESALRSGNVSRGQRMLLLKLARTGLFTVYIVGEDSIGRPTCVEILYPTGKTSKLMDTSYDDMRKRCSDWAEWAEKQPQWTGEKKEAA